MSIETHLQRSRQRRWKTKMDEEYELLLGESDDGRVVVSDDQRKRHMFIVGKSGSGKSKLIEHMVRQDLVFDDRKPGVLLLDPHGDLVNDIVDFLAYTNPNRRVHIFNPSDEKYVSAYNPLRTGTADPDVLAKEMASACAHVYGEHSHSTPMIRETLMSVFYTLIENECTLAEAPFLTTLDDETGIHEVLTSNLGDNEAVERKMRGFQALGATPKTRHEFHIQMSPADRRLYELNMSRPLRNMFGQTEGALNISQAMDDGDVVLVNLSTVGNKISNDDARLLGTLMLRDVYLSAMARPKIDGNIKPFYVYVDECYKFLNQDIENILDEVRKRGVHLTLACQRLGQLRSSGDEMYNGVIGGTEVKAVFGGLEKNDAMEMADEIYMHEYDLQRGVEETKKPVVVAHRREMFHGSSHSFGTTETEGDSWRDGTSEYIAEGDLESEGKTFSDSSGGQRSRSTTETHSSTESEQLVPELEERYSSTWDLQKLTVERATFLKELPTQNAVIYIRNRGAFTVKVPTVNPVPIKPTSETTTLWLKKARRISGIHLEHDEAKKRIEHRQNLLKERALTVSSEDDEPDSYLS